MAKRNRKNQPDSLEAAPLPAAGIEALLLPEPEEADAENAVFDEDKRHISKSVSTTVVGEGACVRGDLCTAGHLQILGDVCGNVEAGGNVIVSGCVQGDVSGASISLNGCVVRGNVTARGELSVNSGSMVAGGLTAKSAVVNGKVRGGVAVEDVVVLHADSLLLGGVSGARITVQEGAAVCGELHVLHREEDEALFAGFDRLFEARRESCGAPALECKPL